MKYENPILETIKFDAIDIITVSSEVSSGGVTDGVIEDNNQLPETEW